MSFTKKEKQIILDTLEDYPSDIDSSVWGKGRCWTLGLTYVLNMSAKKKVLKSG